MKIRELTQKQLQTFAQANKADGEHYEKCLKELRIRKAELDKDISSLERDVARTGRFIALGTEALVLFMAPQPDVQMLREQLQEKCLFATREDIKVSQAKQAKLDIEELTKLLRQACRHQLVIGYKHYAGSYLDDYSDQHPGKRGCCVCGFTETDAQIDQSNRAFPTLIDSPFRVLRHGDYRTFEQDLRQFVTKLTFPELIDAFVTKELQAFLDKL